MGVKTTDKCLVIAEAGVNHNGSVELAMRLVDIAVKAGADAVKFQTFKAENLAGKNAPKAAYQKVGTETQLQMLKQLELSYDDFARLQKYCTEQGILFLSTPFDLESIDFLASLGMPIFKIPSGEITNLPYLRKIAALKKDVILSTGMAEISEIKAALDVLNGCKVTLLHCTTEYPCPAADVNLRAMETLKKKFKLPLGYSDHTQGIEISLAAAALGATVIEKHFTIDNDMEGPDHKASLEPKALRALVLGVRNIEKALGSGVKKPTESELKNIEIVRKSIVAATDIKKGEVFTEENLTVKRPATGISPMKWDEVVGTKAKKDYEADEII